jgi:hypothetical protein
MTSESEELDDLHTGIRADLVEPLGHESRSPHLGTRIERASGPIPGTFESKLSRSDGSHGIAAHELAIDLNGETEPRQLIRLEAERSRSYLIPKT